MERKSINSEPEHTAVEGNKLINCETPIPPHFPHARKILIKSNYSIALNIENKKANSLLLKELCDIFASII